MTPWPLALALAAPLAGRLADRHAAGILGGLGLLSWPRAGVARVPSASGSPAAFVWRMALCGLGFGFFQPPTIAPSWRLRRAPAAAPPAAC